MIVGHALARFESLPGTAPALHDHLPREGEILVKGVVVPARGLRGRVTCLASRALVPRTIRGRRHSRRDSSRSPSARVRSRQSRLRFSDRNRSRRVCLRSRSVRSRSRRLRSRSSGRREARCDRSWSRGSCYRLQDRSPHSSDRSRSRERSWGPGRSLRDRAEAVVASRDSGNSGSRVEPAPAVAGSSIPRLTPSLPDLARLFLSMSGSLA